MIPSTPDISDICQPNTVKSQTILSLSSFVDSPPCRKRLRLAPAKDSVIDQNASMIGAWDKFLDGLVLVTDVERNSGELDWDEDIFDHFLSSQVVVVACEVDNAVDTVGEHGMVVTGGDQVHGMVEVDWEWDAFGAFSAERAFVVAAESVGFAVAGQYDWMKAAACNFDNAFLEDGVGNDVIFFLVIFLVLRLLIIILIIIEIKLLNVR